MPNFLQAFSVIEGTMSFSRKITDWYEENGRSLPWRNIDDPYKIWLSEIILQQTRIEQGMSYYLRFIEEYPTVADLAAASEDHVLKTWQGLGYYSRARNLHAAARYIVDECGGIFPDTYSGILKLKGVGRYTAAAIASFAFRLPHPVIDGNVYRLISRLYGIYTPIGTDSAYTEFENILSRLIDRERPDIFNQAIMDFGSIYCKPVPADCERCIFHNECVARKEGKVSMLPVKAASAQVRQRWLYYYYIEWVHNGERLIFVHQRTGKDIWKGLYEFPLLETDHELTSAELETQSNSFLSSLSDNYTLCPTPPKTFTHKLTHRTINATFVHAILYDYTPQEGTNETLLPEEKLKKLPISRLIDRYLSKR